MSERSNSNFERLPSWVGKAFLALSVVGIGGASGWGTATFNEQRTTSKASTEQVEILRELTQSAKSMVQWQAAYEVRMAQVEAATVELRPAVMALQLQMATLSQEIRGLREALERAEHAERPERPDRRR